MNLHGIVAGAIGIVNPFETVVVSQSIGYVTEDTGRRLPQYSNVPAQAQIQAMSGGDLRQIEGLNLNGEMRAIYFYGDVAATIRADQKGGDIVTRSDGSEWLVAQSLENWPDWCKVVAILQNNTVAT